MEAYSDRDAELRLKNTTGPFTQVFTVFFLGKQGFTVLFLGKQVFTVFCLGEQVFSDSARCSLGLRGQGLGLRF